eukprot:COSAG04_NODE_2003_length_5027_cov_4.937703_4_plen_82_part_00
MLSQKPQLNAASSAAAATRVQSAWRGRLARDDLLLEQLAATDIQARWRGKLHRATATTCCRLRLQLRLQTAAAWATRDLSR